MHTLLRADRDQFFSRSVQMYTHTFLRTNVYIHTYILHTYVRKNEHLLAPGSKSVRDGSHFANDAAYMCA